MGEKERLMKDKERLVEDLTMERENKEKITKEF